MSWIKTKLVYPLFKRWGIFPKNGTLQMLATDVASVRQVARLATCICHLLNQAIYADRNARYGALIAAHVLPAIMHAPDMLWNTLRLPEIKVSIRRSESLSYRRPLQQDLRPNPQENIWDYRQRRKISRNFRIVSP